MSSIFDYPPTLTGTEREQLRQLYSYLYQLMDQLTIRLENIGNGGGTQGIGINADQVKTEIENFRRTLVNVGNQAKQAQTKTNVNAEKIQALVDVVGDMMTLIEEMTGELDGVVDTTINHEERIKEIENVFVVPLGTFILGKDMLGANKPKEVRYEQYPDIRYEGKTLLSEINDDIIFVATQTHWRDTPGGRAIIFTNTQYSEWYNLQRAEDVSNANNVWTRMVRRDGGVYRDWSNSLNLPDVKILAVGDSIAYGVRNGGKSYLVDLGLRYKNISVSGATLSTKRADITNIPQQLINEATSATPYDADVIIAEGCTNDYFQGAPLGTLPVEPATTDTEAAAIDRGTMIGGCEWLFYNMAKYYPDADRYFLIAHKMCRAGVYWPTTQNTAGYTQKDMHDAIVDLCRVYGVRVIDVYEHSKMDTKYQQYRSSVAYTSDNTITDTEYCDSDGIHPCDLGYRKEYIPLVADALMKATKKRL